MNDRKHDAFFAARHALKELNLPDFDDRVKDLAEKCGVEAVAVEVWRPYGGATSFEAADTFRRGQEMRVEYDELNYQLRTLMGNVLDNQEMADGERATAITALAEEFARRAEAIPGDLDDEMDEGESDTGPAFTDRRASTLGERATAEINDLPDSAFAFIEPGGKKVGGKTTPRSKRHFPIHDEAHVRAALSRSSGGQSPFAAKARPKIMAAARRMGIGAEKDSSSFRAFKAGDQWRWFTVYTNTARDKTGERFPAQAHRDYVAWVDKDEAQRMPELWDWHTPVGLALYRDGRKGMGRADFIDYQEGLGIAAGYFYPDFTYAAEALSQEKDLGVSHGYDYQKWALDADTGEYAHYFTFEISPLPRAKAANELTLFLPDMAKEDLMQLRADRRERLVKTHGEAKVKAIEDALGAAAANLKDKEISFKDLEEALDATPPAANPAGDTVPIVQGATAGGAPSEAEKAAKDLIVSAVKEAIAPMETRFASIETRLGSLEGNFKERLDKAVADSFGPRFTPDPSKAPSNDPSNIVNGNTSGMASAVREASSQMKDDPALAGVPEHLRWYMDGLVGAAAAGVVAATDPAPVPA